MTTRQTRDAGAAASPPPAGSARPAPRTRRARASAATTAPARRGPTDLPFSFPDRSLVKALAAEREEPDWLRAERLAAFAAYETLPLETNRLYTTYVDLRSADLAGVSPYVRTATKSISAAAVPPGTSGVIEFREGGIVALALDGATAAAGVRLEPLGAALRRDPDAVRAALEGGRSLPADDKLAQLARGFWSQGVRLAIPDGVRLERPILLRWAVGRPGRALVSRTLVSLGEGAEASIVEELVPSPATDGDRQGFFAGTMEVSLGRAANLSIAGIQELPESVVAFQHRTSLIGPGAQLRWALAQLGGRLVRSRIDNRLEGDGGSVEQAEIVFGSGDQVFDLTSYTRHVGRDTTGNLLSKGVLQDAARTYMKWLITIEKSAVGGDSYLGEFGMNLSKKARSVAIPSLEIDQPNVRRAAHSSSVGPIDEGQIFYLESRGVDRETARRLIVLGFLEPVVARVPLEEAQERLRGLLDAKWGAARGAARVGVAT